MTQSLGLISADDHVLEHPEVWTQRLSRQQWGDRIPHLAEQPDGTQYWRVDGQPLSLNGVAEVGALLADRNQEPKRWDAVPAMAYTPAERLRAMDADGVAYSVLYPTVAGLAGEVFGRITDPALELACVQAYNDWLIEEWAQFSPRFIPQCLVPLAPIESMVAEIQRAVNKGHKGVMLPGIPMHLRDVPHINDPVYDSVWAACQDLDVPLCFHAGASPDVQFPPDPAMSDNLTEAFKAITRPYSSTSVLGNFLVSRILSRFPKLKVIFAESALGWGGYALEAADYHFEQFRLHRMGYDLKPSELFKRQCYLTAWYDDTGLQHLNRHLGSETLLWSTNFPCATSTWPNSQDFIARSFANIDDADRQRVLWDNSAALYGL